ncbi:MAG: peroxiredoxin-like family protein [Asticcacaulis sp.]|uniref:peroxiredoxin-like family protein n=1 Tax=Asticcacaulis sp. TaxID=1872648 RepID=UPI0039E66A80
MVAESLTRSFDALHAERERTWAPEQLQKNIDQRAALATAYDPAAHIQIGDYLPEFALKDVEGGTITQRTLPAGAVFVFFRFAGCPACNIALPYYQRALWPHLKPRGLPLIAVSPQVPERLREIKTRHNLEFIVASDPDNQFGNALGITFEPIDTPATPPVGWIGELTGTQTWTLPQPTIIITDAEGRVRFIDVSPDWLKRTEADVVLEALSAHA